MSSVYLVECPNLPIKRIMKESTDSNLSKAALKRESEVLLQLQNSCIPEVYDFFEDGTHSYLVEEYMDGISLQTILSDHNHLDENETYHICERIADILDYMHHKDPPVLYLDLKPEHVLLRGDKVSLIDFGSSRIMNTTCGEALSGTVEYAAPELAEAMVVSEQADIYSLGKLMSRMLYGEDDFCGKNINGRKSLYYSVIQKACHPNLEERYHDIYQFKTSIDYVHKKTLLPFSTAAGRRTRIKIAVIASEPHMGATHIAIQLTGFLNRKGSKACYYSRDHKRTLVNLGTCFGGAPDTNGRIRIKDFVGDMIYRESEGREREEIQILDFGAYEETMRSSLEDVDYILAVVGGEPWERIRTLSLLEEVGGYRNIAILLNFSDKASARAFCRENNRPVFSMPYGKALFRISKEEERVYCTILKTWGI